jgi:site-specific recombinase XerD
MSLTIPNAVESFLEAKRSQRLSEHTLNDYRNTFRKFASFVGEECRIDHINPETIIRFLASNDTVSKKTTLNYHTALSSLWTHLVKFGRAETNIVRLVDPPRPDEKQIIPFTRGEVCNMLRSMEGMESEERNRAIILTLLDTGLRSSELCALKARDVNFDNRTVRTLGKRGKERYIPFHATTGEVLMQYIQKRGLSGYKKRNMFVFVTLHVPSSQLQKDSLFHIIEKIGLRAAVQNCHPHRFRHTFAIQFLRNGGNIYTLQAILGHTSLDMVKRYLHIAQTDVARDHEKASPVKGWEL